MKMRGWWLAILGTALCAGMATAKTPARLGVVAFPTDLGRELGIDGRGAAIYLVIPNSPAGKAHLQPGDTVTAVDGQTVSSFADLTRKIQGYSAGQPVRLRLLRDGKNVDAMVQLSAWTGELTTDSHRRTYEYLKPFQKSHPAAPALIREIIEERWQSGDRTGATQQLGQALAAFPRDIPLKDRWLELLHKTGDYGQYVREAIRLADADPGAPSLQLHKIEALLATGKNAAAEEVAQSLAESRGFFGVPTDDAIHARKQWVVARLRQGKSLVEARAPSTAWSHKELAVLEVWRKMLAGRPTYVVDAASRRSELELVRSGVFMGLAPYAMHGIPVTINGVSVPLAIIDTGASHTLISEQTAKGARVPVGTASRSAAGSLSFVARSGVVDELKIGGVVIRNLPVSVGNPPPMVMTKAKVAIGVDVMQHLRFTIDYPGRRVTVEPAVAPMEEGDAASVWDIPLWTFSEHCLSQAKLENGAFVRTLIDSGNFAFTLVWPDWARQHFPNHKGAGGSMLLYAFSDPQHKIRGLELGGRQLPEWPAVDMPPITLQGIDLLDLLMGHDLLSQYRVIIDMPGRRLRLVSTGKGWTPPTPPKPLAL